MNNKKSIELADPMPTPTNSILKAALAYSQLLNWAVFPLHTVVNGHCTCGKKCTSPGKHPRTLNGLKDATTDTNQIKEWFTRWSNSNIGIATGKISGFFVLDVDAPHGFDSMENLIEQFDTLPDTVEQITGSRGSHFLFKYVEGVGNKTNILPGLDIRGDGGYITVAPSYHISGNRYEWELSSHPLQVKIEDAPEWLINMILEPKTEQTNKRPSSYWVDIMKGVGKGERNDTAAKLAGYLFRRFIDPKLVIEIMALWNERNDPPLDEKELFTIINSIAGKELARRRKKHG